MQNSGEIIRYIKATWPNDFAIFDSKTVFTTNAMNRNWNGEIKIEVPLETRHYGNILYDLKENQFLTTGNTVVEYNKKKILTGNYNCKSESK